MLNTKLLVPSVGFSIAGLDRAKLGVYPISKFFVYCCHSNVDFDTTYILTNFNL